MFIVQGYTALISSTFRLEFCCFFFALIRSKQHKYQLFLLRIIKLDDTTEKIMIDNLELSLLLVMMQKFCWWMYGGAINDMHTNFFPCSVAFRSVWAHLTHIFQRQMLSNFHMQLDRFVLRSMSKAVDITVSLWKISWGSHWNQFAVDVKNSGKVFIIVMFSRGRKKKKWERRIRDAH